MTRRRWIADEVSGDRAALVGEHAAHLARVLRAHVGQEFDISANGEVRRGVVSEVTPERVVFDLGQVVELAATAEVKLLLAVFKFDRFEWAVEKCTELGVAEIVPVVSKRVDEHLAVAARKRVERWRRLAVQASEQSRRAAPPAIAEPVKLKDACRTMTSTRLVLAESGAKLPLKAALRDSWTGGTIALAVGPEGGWSKEELDLLFQSGWLPVTLGNTILRAETAAIAALAVVFSETL